MSTIDLLNKIFEVCVVPLLGVLTAYIIQLIRKKTQELNETIDNDLVEKYLNMLIDIIVSCVMTTNQTYVDSLKDKDAFTEEAQLEAFSKTYNNVMALLTEEAKKVLTEAYGDLPLLVTQLIERKVAEYKK